MNASQQAPVALITGAAKRLGAATARALHQQGYTIAVHYRHSKSAANALCAELNALRTASAVSIPARLEVIEEVEALAHTTVQTLSRCDVLINNASAYYATPLTQATPEHWDELFASNAKAPYFLSKYLAPELSQREGVIINITDIHAQRPKNLFSIYCMAKAANMMMTKALALELSPHVRVNGIAPGAALWPENAQGEAMENPQELEAVPMKTLGGSESIVETVLFLVQQARYITGQCINVDGGRTLIQ